MPEKKSKGDPERIVVSLENHNGGGEGKRKEAQKSVRSEALPFEGEREGLSIRQEKEAS